MPRFNVTLVEEVYHNVYMSPSNAKRRELLSSSRVVTVQCMTNSLELQKGEQLFLEVPEPRKKRVATEESWQSARKRQQVAAAKASPKSAARPQGGGTGSSDNPK